MGAAGDGWEEEAQDPAGGAGWVQVGTGSKSPQALNTLGPQSSELWQESQVVS